MPKIEHPLQHHLATCKKGHNIQPFLFQLDRAKEMANKLLDGAASAMLTDQAGYGKTYMLCFAVKELEARGFFGTQPLLWPAVWITKASVIEQTKRVIKLFNLDHIIRLVTNPDQLRASFGETFIKFQWEIERGEEVLRCHWSPFILKNCKLFIIDECQWAKNKDALQTRILQEAIDFLSTQKAQQEGLDNIRFLFSSATPFTKVSEAKVFCTSTRIPVQYGLVKQPLCHKYWPSFACEMAGNSNPNDHSPTAVKRLREYMNDYISCTKYQEVQHSFAELGRKLYRAENGVLLIDFSSPEKQQYYNDAYQKYLEELAKLDRNAPGGIAAIWVAILKFRMAAEECRADDIAESMYQCVTKDGVSCASAFNFKKPIGMAVKYLIEKRGVKREDISIIWGGIQDIEDESAYLGLGPQSHKARQKEIDRFQTDQSHYCFYTFKAGGVGLSLHHAEPWMRQRRTFLSPTYSAIELAQALGRVPRITSWSNTPQFMVFFNGTIEVQVAAKVAIKMKCLKEAVMARETWAEELIPKERLMEVREMFVKEEQQLIESKIGEDEMDGLYIEDEV